MAELSSYVTNEIWTSFEQVHGPIPLQPEQRLAIEDAVEEVLESGVTFTSYLIDELIMGDEFWLTQRYGGIPGFSELISVLNLIFQGYN